MCHPRPLFDFLWAFQVSILQQVRKCEKNPASIRWQHSNSQPLVQESPPIDNTYNRAPILQIEFIWNKMLVYELIHNSSNLSVNRSSFKDHEEPLFFWDDKGSCSDFFAHLLFLNWQGGMYSIKRFWNTLYM